MRGQRIYSVQVLMSKGREYKSKFFDDFPAENEMMQSYIDETD